MPTILDSHTGIAMGDPSRPLMSGSAPRLEDIADALRAMILSASGWRAVFAADADEESHTNNTSDAQLVLAAIAARSLCSVLGNATTREQKRISVGLDTRPTGPSIAHAAIRSLQSIGWGVDYLFICASPEIMAYTRGHELAGFYYVTASHNPIGHNGLKLGTGDGSVAGGELSKCLIADFMSRCGNAEEVQSVIDALMSPGIPDEAEVFASAGDHKEAALLSYREFSTRVIGGDSPAGNAAFGRLSRALADASPGVVVDFNGSARTTSIDLEYFAAVGCRTVAIHEKPGDIAHQIVPENAGLDECRDALARAGETEEGFLLGFVPDNDGDRGNIVYRTDDGGVVQLGAQEVFALACVAELAWLEHIGPRVPSTPVAVVVNGPTSMRIERIGSLFGVEVYRAEVGEANVVNRARELRRAGYEVRILGEGSNGGNITHPSAVRDPLHTVFALLKLLFTPPADQPAPVEIWAAKIGKPAEELRTLDALVGSLPRFTTTGTHESRAIMKVESENHAQLKAKFESVLDQEWPNRQGRMKAVLGVESSRIVNYEGTAVRVGAGNRTGNERGGLKVELVDAEGVARAFLWMRGSGTEPVFRILVDVEGEQSKLEAELLEWLGSMVGRADGQSPTDKTAGPR